MKKQRLKLTPEQSVKLNRDIKRLANDGLIDREIGEKLGFHTRTISRRRAEMGIPANGGNHVPKVWSDDRLNFLMDNYHLGARYVADKLGLSLQSVYSKAKHVGFLSCTTPWDSFEDDFIQSVINEAAEKLERKPEAIAKRFLWLSSRDED